MSILFISAGGSSKYTQSLIHSLYQSSLSLSPEFACLTLYPLPEPQPSHATYFPLQKNSSLSQTEWNTEMLTLTLSLIESSQAETIIFEGSFVYSAILQVMKKYPSHYYIWLKPPTAPSLSPNRREKYFDEIILPSNSSDILTFLNNLNLTLHT